MVGFVVAAAVVLLLSGCDRKTAPAASSQSPAAPSAPSRELLATGEQVYLKNCAQCHMADGGGVPNMQPELVGSAIIAGEPAKLEAVIRSGSFALRDRKSDFQNEMPPFAMLSDTEVKAVMAYVRAKFGKKPAGS